MRYEILFGKGRDHDKRYPEASQGKVTRLVRCRHDRRYAIGAGYSDWPNVIVKAAAFIECLDKNRIFPRWAVHESVDQFRRKLRAQLNMALRVLIHTAAAGSVNLYSSLYVGNLRQSPVLYVNKILTDQHP